MKIYLTRHGQTNLNKQELMQGRTDEPLNDTGREQAKHAREFVKDIEFDAVYSSPLIRAKETASIIGNIPAEKIIIDPRIVEADFGEYELRSYHKLGLKLTSYWMFPEIFPAPYSVETVEEMIDRTHSFLRELEAMDYEKVLVVCHGGIIRPMCGYLTDAKRGFVWRPRPQNCEIRVFESIKGKHRFVESYV